MESALLRDRIHDMRKKLALTDKELFNIHLQTTRVMSSPHWDLVDRITSQVATATLEKCTKRQKLKFEHLLKERPAAPTLDTKRTVVNLSSRQLTNSERTILSKGGNFAVVPSSIPVEDIIANVESGIRNLPSETAEEIRRESSRILQYSKPPKCNITKGEKAALRELNSDESIVILSADKGNATVILNRTDYERKIEELLDPSTYKKLKCDPTARILKKTNMLIKKSSINDEEKKKLTRSEALPPRLYGLPKIHKQNVPLRPIVSAIDSPTYGIAKHLTALLSPHTGKTNSYIKDSAHFIEQLSQIRLQPNDILVSFDVVSLFTNVPVPETLDLLRKVFSADIADVFHHVLTTTYFKWNNCFYEQIDGVAMGSPLSPVVANFYMEAFEQIAIATASLRPSVWLRYVDDTFVVWPHGETALSDFLLHLNTQHPKIQFTIEKEENSCLPFLDVLVTKKPDGTLGHSVYRKQTHTDRYLHKTSNHHPGQKRAVLKTLVHRAQRICEPMMLQSELQHLNHALQANGYSNKEILRATRPRRSEAAAKPSESNRGTAYLPYIPGITDKIGKMLQRHNVKAIYRPTRQISSLLRSVKDPRDPLSTAGVYRIPCACGAVYIGTTLRSINTRISEHKRHCRLGQTDKSAVAEHAFENGDHTIQFQATEVLSTVSHYHTRLNREAIEIFKHRNNFNKKEEGLRISKTWNPVLAKINIKPLQGLQPSNQGTAPQPSNHGRAPQLSNESTDPQSTNQGTANHQSCPVSPDDVSFSSEPPRRQHRYLLRSLH